MAYFLIYQFDTEATVGKLGKGDLLTEIEQGAFPNGFLSTVEDSDPARWGEKVLVIKGEIVTPKEVQRVTEYDID